jgi:Haloacid dehalogenase-like hydrolase
MTGRLLLVWAGLLAAVTTAAVIVAPAVLAGLSVQGLSATRGSCPSCPASPRRIVASPPANRSPSPGPRPRGSSASSSRQRTCGTLFQVVMSTETVGRGKPAPDVNLAVARRLRIAPTGCAAVEDSTNGLRAARAAGMRVIAVPNRDYLPHPDDLARADAVIESLDDLTEAVIDPALR